MDFVVIDFETANAARSSACEIGATRVRNNVIEETKSWLIKPDGNRFDPFYTQIHGISADMVANEREFPEVFENVLNFVDGNLVVAHNAAFDMSVIRYACDLYGMKYPSLKYICSYLFSRKLWAEFPCYDLRSLSRKFNLPAPDHRGGTDSLSTALLTILALEKIQKTKEEDIFEDMGLRPGLLLGDGYQTCSSTLGREFYFRKKVVLEPGKPENFNEENIFYQKNVCFTGKLLSMQRIEAQQAVLNVGGNVTKTVNKTTDFLIVGLQDFRVVGDDGMSEKQEKAIKMVENGDPIEIMSESDFLKNIEHL